MNKTVWEWRNLKSLWNSLIFLHEEHNRLFAGIIRLCRVSFSAVDIIISKEEEIFGPKILMMETKISFLSEGLAVWRLSKPHFKSVWAETVKNYPARKLELICPQNKYIGYQYGIWKIMGNAIFFVKRFLLI